MADSDNLNDHTYDPNQDSDRLASDPHFQADLNQQLKHHFDSRVHLERLDDNFDNGAVDQSVGLMATYLDGVKQMVHWNGAVPRLAFFVALFVQWTIFLLGWWLLIWLGILIFAHVMWMSLIIMQCYRDIVGAMTIWLTGSLLIHRLHDVGLYGRNLFYLILISSLLLGIPFLIIIWLPSNIIKS